MEKKFYFTPVQAEPIFKGLYKDKVRDLKGFRLSVVKSGRPYKQRNWGDDREYDTVMSNFGTMPTEGEVEQQLIFGWANVTLQEDGTPPLDWQGDIIKTEELETAAYNYVLNFGIVNRDHEWSTDCGWIVESMMFTKDKMGALGIPEGTVPEGWWLGFYIPDPEVYAKVKDGTYKMFSIEGSARRIPVDQ